MWYTLFKNLSWFPDLFVKIIHIFSSELSHNNYMYLRLQNGLLKIQICRQTVAVGIEGTRLKINSNDKRENRGI